MLANSLPLSDWRISGYPCIKTWAIAFLNIIASLFLNGIAQACSEKRSTQVCKYGDLFIESNKFKIIEIKFKYLIIINEYSSSNWKIWRRLDYCL